MEKLSVIVPCYNEEKVIKIFYNELIKYIKELKLDYEIIFVNDGSKDQTLQECLLLKKEDKNIIIINFSRNFGKEAAIYAGLKESKGDLVSLMDADLQDPPYLLPKMYKQIKEDNCDNVATYRVSRKGEPKIRSFFARAFYRIVNKMIDVEIVDGARDFRLMKRSMVEAILELHEYHRFSKGIFAWVGFNTKYIDFENVERAAGETKWSFWGLFKYAIEGMIAFTTLPLRLATISGIIVSLLGFLYMTFIFAKTMIFGDPVSGFPSLIVIITILGGIQLLFLGVIGEYIAKTYMESKRRPVYIIKEKL